MATMRLLFFTLITVILSTAPAYPADELFDTTAAAKHMEQGFAHLNAKDFDAAISEFEASAGISPEAEPYYFLGYAYYLKGKKDNGASRQKSLENFEKAFEIDPNFSPMRNKPAEPPVFGIQEPSSKPTETVEPAPPAQTEPQPVTEDQPKP